MRRTIKLEEKVRAKGWETAQELRKSFRQKGIFVVNLIGSPGAGKTSLLEALAPRIIKRAAVIEGDLQTDEDKRRVERAGIRAYQINTAGACHLDAGMIRDALARFPLDNVDLLFVENVGNLVCPASFEIGEDMKVAVVSVTEGDDKAAKYPTAMRVSSALVITKMDLLPHVSCDVKRLERDVRSHRPDIAVFATSAKTGEGVGEFLGWIDAQARARRESAPP
jgi:hydrogenase nickel incorporation protein HypB